MSNQNHHRAGFNPLQQHAVAIHEACEQLGKNIQSAVQHMQRQIDAPVRELATAATTAVRHLQAQLANNWPGQSQQPQLALASMSANIARNAASNPVFELAYNPEEIKERLKGIAVYAVVNQKNEFVLVSGDDPDSRQLGIFFFDRADAEELIATVKEQNPKLGRQARIMSTTMDNVYEFAVSPRETSGTDGVVFRFMPGAAEVQAALELYRAAGLNTTAFTGVPLFQAEGLTVRGKGGRFTPLFFSKKDLDAALKDAYMTRDTEAQADARSKMERAMTEVADARAELEAADSNAKAKRAAERRAETAQKRVDQYSKRLDEATAEKKLPRVDVGCLEEVIVKMEADDKNEWGDVMFVPPNALTGGAAGAQGKNDGANKNGKKK